MKRTKFLILGFLSILFGAIDTQGQCNLEATSIVCPLEKIFISYSSETIYNNVIVSAFNQTGITNIPALIQNKTNTSAEIIFLESGNAEIVIQYYQNGDIVDICNQNIIIFGDEPIPALGMVGDFLGDQIACEAIDIDFNILLNCFDCTQSWTINGEPINLEEEVFAIGNSQSITTSLAIDSLGEYTLCQTVLRADSACSVDDCIQINIIEIIDSPSFEIEDEENLTYCLGSEIDFLNLTEIDENVTYHWSISYDSLIWNYYTEDLNFHFDLPGEYIINLEYTLSSDSQCTSPPVSNTVNISDAPTLFISCDGQLCFEDEITYRSPINCTDYEWIVDPTLGTIINQVDSIVTIQWNEVTEYTETEIVLLLNGCQQNVCQELSSSIDLFPSEISIEGAINLCENGEFIYNTEYIPGATYSWEIEIVDSISGVSPSIILLQDNSVTLEIFSFVGEFNLAVTSRIEDRGCEVSKSQSIKRFNFNHNDNLCKEGLFKAEFFPQIEEDITWTILKEDGSIFKEEIKSGLNAFLAFGFPEGGTYTVSARVPSLDFDCESGLTFQVVETPEIELSGPLSICIGEEYEYTLLGLGANDIVIWEVFQNGMFTEIISQTINVTWLDGADPYLIRVTKNTETSPGQICESDDQLYEIKEKSPDSLNITGEEIVCYDAISTYQMSIPGIYDWEITPSYMGTIIEGGNTENITIQWHYASDVETAALSFQTELCGASIFEQLVVTFVPFQPIVNLPDSICQGIKLEIGIENLLDYDVIEYYINDELVADDRLSYSYTFNQIGWVDIRLKILNPNDCPGLTDITIPIFVKSAPTFEFEFSAPIVQCPQDSFETIIVTPSTLNDQYYYQWVLDGDIIKEGFGNMKIYSYLITKDMIFNNNILKLNITAPNSCVVSKDIPLNYECSSIIPACQCKEEVLGSIDYINKHECNLISFGGSLDFSTILSADWVIPQGDSLTFIPINSPADLIQDSIYLAGGQLGGAIAIRVSCAGQIEFEDGTIQDTVCDFIQVEESFPLFSPSFRSSYICNENLNYDITLETRKHPFYSPDSYYIKWVIDNVDYTGESVELLNISPNSELSITITQCTLDSSYCCTNDIIFNSPQPFNPQIILPNGSCENELWLFTVDESPLSIQSILWDFGDDSGSTLVTTEKGYKNTDEQTISVIVTNDRGCIAYDTIVVESFENLIDGEIDFISAPCDSDAPMTYIEYSSSEIISYEWNVLGTSDTSSIIATQSGTYSITVTDNHGCTDISTLESASINESFSGGIFVKTENCGIANAHISENDQFSYTWYINGDSISTGSNISINESGQFDILVTSTQVSTNVLCNSISEFITVFPNPDLPDVTIDKTYCDPLIAKLTVNNHPQVTWTGIGINETAQTFHTSSPGFYSASYTDENGCTSSIPLNILDNKVDFDYLTNICIQACREDLDSLQLIIPGNIVLFEEWSWNSMDSNGMEYIISTSTGSVPDLIITNKMYNYLELIVTKGDCNYSSGRIPIDIIQCIIIEEDEEILCDTIDIFSSSCGFTVYECVVSEENGGPKFYYEGHISTSLPVDLCRDSLIASISNGQIEILSFETIVNSDGTLHIDYSANIFIDNVLEFENSPTYIHFDFCDTLDEETYCVEYVLPYRTCYIDFDCLIDCVGIYYGTDEYVNVNYCLNLSDIIQEDCILESYYMTLAMTNDFDSKIIYEKVITEDFDQLYCLDIPISIEDFTSGEFECLEMIVEGDCPDILCYDYQCGAFSPGFSAGIDNGNNKVASARQPFKIKSLQNPELKVYPNPNKGKMTISYSDFKLNDKYVIRNALGQVMHKGKMENSNLKLDFTGNNQGLYFISIKRDEEILASKKVILVD